MPVRQLLESIDSAELSEWIAYYGLEPFGEERADMRTAIVAHVVAAVNGVKDCPPEKFLASPPVKPPEQPRPQTVAEQKNIFHRIAAALKTRKQV